MSSYPLTVIVTAFNGEKYLRQTIDSLLAQTYEDFELLAVDDASTDGSLEVLNSYRDSRMRVVGNERNLGHTGTLIRALELAGGEYIARADQDDLSLPDRLERQLSLLRDNPEFSVVSTGYVEIDGEGREGKRITLPADEDVIRLRVITENPIVHSSVMYSAAAVRSVGGYDSRYRFIQDWDLWSRLLAAGHRILNIPDLLIKYRRFPQSSSGRVYNKVRHEEIPRLIRENLMRYAGIELTGEEAGLFYHVRYLPDDITGDKVGEAVELCERITARLGEMAVKKEVERELSRLRACLHLHAASAAMRAGKRSLARRLYAGMIGRGEYPLGALARYGASFLGQKLGERLRGAFGR